MIVALLACYLTFMVAVFAWPSWRLWRRERINAFVLPRDDTAEGVIGLWFKAIIAILAALLLGLALGLPSNTVGRLQWL